jgi:hypothetical protein
MHSQACRPSSVISGPSKYLAATRRSGSASSGASSSPVRGRAHCPPASHRGRARLPSHRCRRGELVPVPAVAVRTPRSPPGSTPEVITDSSWLGRSTGQAGRWQSWHVPLSRIKAPPWRVQIANVASITRRGRTTGRVGDLAKTALLGRTPHSWKIGTALPESGEAKGLGEHPRLDARGPAAFTRSR